MLQIQNVWLFLPDCASMFFSVCMLVHLKKTEFLKIYLKTKTDMSDIRMILAVSCPTSFGPHSEAVLIKPG